MVGKDKPTFHTSHYVTAITFLMIGIIATDTLSRSFPRFFWATYWKHIFYIDIWEGRNIQLLLHITSMAERKSCSSV